MAAARRVCSSSCSARSGAGILNRCCYLDFAFPPYWHYDVLRALDYFREVGDPPDARVDDAIDLVLDQRLDDDRWPAAKPRRGEVFFPLDAPEGEPSRWNTLRALRVLRWAGR
jgi:hypothetical protein